MNIATLKPRVGSRKKRHKLGRGNASGSGRTAGRGEKGQKARTGGKVRPGFEGGQMPLYRRLPKFGFKSRKQILGLNNFEIVNLKVLESFDNGAVVDHQALKDRGISMSASQRAGIKVLGFGELSKKLTVKVSAISASAKKKIEALGGTVELV